MIPLFLKAHPEGVYLHIKLQPRATKSEIGPVVPGPELKIRVTAPPVDAAANDALLRLLSDTLDLPRNRVQLAKGHTSRHKVVFIAGGLAEEIWQKLLQLGKE